MFLCGPPSALGQQIDRFSLISAPSKKNKTICCILPGTILVASGRAGCKVWRPHYLGKPPKCWCFPDVATTVGFPIVNEACCVCPRERGQGKELPFWYCRTTSRGSLTTFRYARTIYAPRSPRIWRPFVPIRIYVREARVRARVVGSTTMCNIRSGHSSYHKMKLL